MGVTGTEGVFRLCCIETMRLLRGHQESMLTILEVFFSDPLYSFEIKPAKKKDMQSTKSKEEDADAETGAAATGTGGGAAGGGGYDDEVSGGKGGRGGSAKEAQRVLTGVKNKLDGVDGGARLSIEGQVNFLIKEATSEVNLSQLFVVWSSWV